MQMQFQTIGSNTYLSVDLGNEDEIDAMSLGMLTNNQILGFAPASYTQMDSIRSIKYNITSLVSAKQLFSGIVNRKRLIGVLTGVVDAMLSATEYMLDPQSILLDMDYIFTNVSTSETVMVCVPVFNAQQSQVDLGMFFKNIIFATQFDQTENCDHVAQIINYLNVNPVVSLLDFKELLSGLSKHQNPVNQHPIRRREYADTPMNVKSAAVQNPVPVQQPQPQMPQQFPVQQPQMPQYQPQVQQPVAPAPFPAQPAPGWGNSPDFAVKQPQNNNPVHIPDTIPQPASPAQPAYLAPDEKPMSMMYLLQHYNKENAAKYKAQKEAKKNANAQAAPVKPSKKAAKKAAQQPAMGFAIPGQQAAQINANYPTPFHNQGNQQQPMYREQPAVQQSVRQPAQQPMVQQPMVQQPMIPQPVERPAVPINFGETTVLGGPQIGETTVLDACQEPNRLDPHLIRSKTNERIELNKPVFRLGKERSYVDYFIGDNTAISRSHANIVNHDGAFYIVDTNSTNHTYVNGTMIQSNVETILTHGIRFRLANEEFEFRLR